MGQRDAIPVFRRRKSSVLLLGGHTRLSRSALAELSVCRCSTRRTALSDARCLWRVGRGTAQFETESPRDPNVRSGRKSAAVATALLGLQPAPEGTQAT